MITQYLIRIVGDLNEQLPALPVPQDPRGIFFVLKQLDDAIVTNLEGDNGAMSQTERIRLRNELERGRGIVAQTFDEYQGTFKVEEAIGRVYERSLEAIEEPFGVDGWVPGNSAWGDIDDEEMLQEGIMDDIDVG
jgi:Subunit 11 of the general transcription factor TFIIH